MTDPSPNPLAWITGAGGLIGHQLLQTAPRCAPARHPRGLLRSDLDLLDTGAVDRAFRAERPQLVIHCAGLTRNPACQVAPALARRLNVEVTMRLAELAEDIPFVFLSTDLVFDGRTGNYDETAPINPLSVYGETKALAEQLVLRNPRHTVIRTSLNAGRSSSGDRSFTEQMRLAWLRGEICRLFVDEFRCPIPAAVTARVIWEMVSQSRPGLFHVAGAERLSRWDIGRLLLTRLPQFTDRIERASVRDYTSTPRPADTSLNCAKVQALLSFPLPRFSEWLMENPDEPLW